MPTDPHLILAQWFSPSFPVGAFSFSHGLEQVIEDGQIATDADLRFWLQAILRHGTGRNDAILLASAYRSAATDLDEINDLSLAFCGSAGRRLETTEMGASFARTLRDMHGCAVADMTYPVVVGHAAKAFDLPLPATLRFYLQAMIANLVSAAVRRVPLGQTDGQSVLAALQNDIEASADAAMDTTTDDLHSSILAAEIAAMRHETLYSKVFRT